MRRATNGREESLQAPLHFYPRSPCGERRDFRLSTFDYRLISIHALLAESDLETLLTEPEVNIFLSTLSLRRATPSGTSVCHVEHNFYPRSPCGERQVVEFNRHFSPEISIHALLAESDFRASLSTLVVSISIHALLAESDCDGRYLPSYHCISIHALLAESDRQ